MIVFIYRVKSIPKSFSLLRIAYKLTISTLILVWTPLAEAQSLTSRLKVGLALHVKRKATQTEKFIDHSLRLVRIGKLLPLLTTGMISQR